MPPESTNTKLATSIAYVVAVALLLLAINLWTAWPLFSGFALQALILGSALLLTFIAGMRWGLVLASHSSGQSSAIAMLVAVLPAVYALICLLLHRPLQQLTGLLVGFVLLLLVERWWLPPMPASRLRLRLGLLIVAAMLVAIVRVYQWS